MTRPRLEIWLEVEPSCNLRCQFCYNWWRDGQTPAPRRLNTSELLEGMNRLLAHADLTQVTLSGGEPLLRSDLDDIVEFFCSQGVPVILATNGTALTLSRIRHLIELGVETFQIPLHSASQRSHDALVGGPFWRRALESILDVREAGGRAALVFVAARANLADLPGVVFLAHSLGLRDIIFNRLIPSGLAAFSHTQLGIPTDEELLQALLKVAPLVREGGIVVHLGVPIPVNGELRAALPSLTDASCPIAKGQRRWTIGTDGSIRRCSHSQQSIGTLLDSLNPLLDEIAAQSPQHSGRCCSIVESSLVQIKTRGHGLELSSSSS